MWLINLENVSNFVTHTLTLPRCEHISNENVTVNSDFGRLHQSCPPSRNPSAPAHAPHLCFCDSIGVSLKQPSSSPLQFIFHISNR